MKIDVVNLFNIVENRDYAQKEAKEGNTVLYFFLLKMSVLGFKTGSSKTTYYLLKGVLATKVKSSFPRLINVKTR